ncbi:hypothetical protein BJX63DRAFT_407183 [Aspergillus granulosus]|uniref:Uncharacterized protein n=1 Tax=Aspergillus granulosus TaxID=176169 RepID=A0ABR4H0K3_9EURO
MHPEAWATAAKDDDPAARLAFRVTVKDKHSETHVIYPRAIPPSTTTVFRSSSLVDRLDGATYSDLAKRRRRYVNFADHLVNVPAELEFFRGGGYVLDDGTWAKSVGKKRPLPDNSIEARANKKAIK